MVHELHLVPQHSEHFSPHLQSADLLEAVFSVFVVALSEPMANTPAKRNAKIADFIICPYRINVLKYIAAMVNGGHVIKHIRTLG